MNIDALNQQMLILFALIFVGYGASKLHLLRPGANRHLSDLVVNVTCPATTLYAVATSSRLLSNGDVLLVLGVTCGIFAGVILFATLFARLLGLPRENRGIYRFMLVFGNVGFLGYPVLQALSGADAVFVASMFNLVFQLLCYTYGVAQIAPGGFRSHLNWRTFASPMILASLLGLVLYLLGVVFPPSVVHVLGYLDRITAPASMLAIGCTLAAFPLRQVFTQWRIYLLCGVKLLVIPLAVWAVLRLFPLDPLIFQVMVVLSALPSAANATLLTAMYDGDQASAASGVFLSTLLGVVTLPLLLKFLF